MSASVSARTDLSRPPAPPALGEPPTWTARCLDVARYSAIAVAVCAPISTALTSVAAGMMLLAWLLSGAPHHVLAEALRQPVGKALAIFLLVTATGLLYGVAPVPDRWAEFLGWRRLGYALLLLGLFGESRWKQRFVKAFVAAATLGAVASFVAMTGWLPAKTNQAAGVLMQNHAVQGITFGLALLCALHLSRGFTDWRRWTLLALAALFAANIVFVTPARSGYLAMLVALLMWGWAIAGWRRATTVTALIMAVMTAAYLASPTMRMRTDLAVHETLHAHKAEHLTSMGTRVLFYQTAVEMIRERALLGYGSAGFGTEYSRIVGQRYSDWRATPAADPHNIYLLILANHGVFGLAAFFYFLYCALRHAPRDAMEWIGTGSLLIVMATSLFSSHFRTFPEGHLIGMFLGAMLARQAARTPA